MTASKFYHDQGIFYDQCLLSRNPCDCPACESPEPKGKKRKRAQQKVSPKKVKQNHSDLLSRVSKAFDETLEKLENDVDDPEEMNIEEVSMWNTLHLIPGNLERFMHKATIIFSKYSTKTDSEKGFN